MIGPHTHSDRADRHPWLARFEADPEGELERLLAGFVRLPPYEQAEAPDLAVYLFGRLPAGDPARAALDEAMGRWLAGRRTQDGRGLKRGALNRWLAEIMDAFAISAALELPDTIVQLRTGFIAWNAWTERHNRIGRPDARIAYWALLARTQRWLARHDPQLDAFALEPLWLTICRESGSRYPESYLTTGLLGLRTLPERKSIPEERPALTGLALWAAMQQPSLAQFQAEWWTLKKIYALNTSNSWQAAVRQTLDQKISGTINEAIRSFWERDVGLHRADQSSRVRTSRYVREAPSIVAVNELCASLHKPIATLRSRIGNLIAERARWARETGDYYPVVVTASRIGWMLVRSPGKERAERGEIAGELAIVALQWNPDHQQAWLLWRQALFLTGQDELGEKVGWRIIQLFPHDFRARCQLAEFLVKSPDRWDDAEALLRETMERFPDDQYAPNQLAHLLLKWEGRVEHAEPVLRHAIDKFGSVYAINQLAYLLSRKLHRPAEAETLLIDFLNGDSPRSEKDVLISIIELTTLMARDPNRFGEAVKFLEDGLVRFRTTARAQIANQLAYLYIRSGQMAKARSLLEETLETPDLPSDTRRVSEEYLSFTLPAAPSESRERALDAVHQSAVRTEAPEPSFGMQGTGADEAAGRTDPPPADLRASKPTEAADMPERRADPPATRALQNPAAEISAPAADRTARPAASAKPRRPAAVRTSLLEKMTAIAAHGGDVRRLATQFRFLGGNERRELADSPEVRKLLLDHRTSYGDYFLQLLGGPEDSDEESDNAALTFVHALRNGDLDRLRSLSGRRRGLRHFVDVAEILLDQDPAAASRTAAWLGRSPEMEPRALGALRKFLWLRLGSEVADSVNLVRQLAANDNVALDLEEAALADVDITIAA